MGGGDSEIIKRNHKGRWGTVRSSRGITMGGGDSEIIEGNHNGRWGQ